MILRFSMILQNMCGKVELRDVFILMLNVFNKFIGMCVNENTTPEDYGCILNIGLISLMRVESRMSPDCIAWMGWGMEGYEKCILYTENANSPHPYVKVVMSNRLLGVFVEN